ncbi:MAG: diadenylate cyclase CdaA [Eubacteriales bacterium]|nr:diadenylate cyclase CdaA [Eubacteriales bacterium]MDD3199743.1 diadenylate cyclase CdaA [Eubacteriales bacterium]MDD4121336.1 diadenylate cyclase CdaA [Eubacteriales bacterium]MDD4630181.1 diadenylate cyclase CdaA [Eubacteriales bacterium]
MSEVFTNIISGIGITDVIDVAIVAFVIYKILGFIRETRALQLVKGLLILVLITVLSEQLNFYTLNWILRNTISLGVIALVIVFQPELRRALEYVGRSKFITPTFAQMDKEKVKTITSAIIKAVDFFSSNKVGALIIMERETTLNDIAETGTRIDAEISTELLGNIFHEGAPLHDGATIVRGDRVFAAGCVLPLSQSKTLSKELGTRHRAGIGITENSDAIAIIVSEETGIISIAVDGKLSRFLDLKTVEKTLLNIYLSQVQEEEGKVPFLDFIRRRKDDKQ